MDTFMKMLSIITLGVAVSACVPTTPSYLTAPANPRIGARSPGYASVTAGIRNYDVVEPLDWREQNRRVAPGAGPESGDSNDAARRGR